MLNIQYINSLKTYTYELLTLNLTQPNPSKLGLKPNKYGPSTSQHPPQKKTNPFPEAPTEFSCLCVLISLAKNLHLRRVPQTFSLSKTPAKHPAWAAARGPQKCRNRDPFSPQAWWGDDGARQVLKHVTGSPCARQLPMLKICSTPLPLSLDPCPSGLLWARLGIRRSLLWLGRTTRLVRSGKKEVPEVSNGRVNSSNVVVSTFSRSRL